METIKNNIESFTFTVEENISSPKKLFPKITLEEIAKNYSDKIYASSFKIEQIN